MAKNYNTTPTYSQYIDEIVIDTAKAYPIKMTTLRENLDREMKLRGWSAYRMEAESGVSQPTTYRFLKGATAEPMTQIVRKWANALKISEGELRGFSNNNYSNSEIDNVELYKERIVLVPLIDFVQAGTWCEANDPFPSGYAEEWMPCPVAHSSETYALKVMGDSMTSPYPGQISFPEGMIIFCDPNVQPVSGSKVIAKIAESVEVTFKVYREDMGKRWLMPINPTYERIELVEGMHICGVIIFAGFKL